MDRRAALKGLAGVAVGAAAWSGLPYALGLSILLLWLWSAPRRSESAAGVYGYYLAAAFSLWPGSASFFDSNALGLAIWVLVPAILTAPWAWLWRPRPSWWRGPMALVLTALPPLGIIGFYSPFTSAGELWPGTGWFGLAAVAITAAFVGRRATAVGVAVIVAACGINLWSSEAQLPAGWVAISSADGGRGYGRTGFSDQEKFFAFERLFERANAAEGRVILFPESAVPEYTPLAEEFFKRDFQQLAEAGKTVIFGADIPQEEGLFNGLLVRGTAYGEWHQRISVPGVMWRPWDRTSSTHANFAGPHTIVIAGERVSPFICYELSLVWPVLLAQLERPTLIAVASNTYWAKGTPANRQFLAVGRAWGRLFHVPTLTAINS